MNEPMPPVSLRERIDLTMQHRPTPLLVFLALAALFSLRSFVGIIVAAGDDEWAIVALSSVTLIISVVVAALLGSSWIRVRRSKGTG